MYFATILHANKLRVAALLDSDAAGNQAAAQDSLVHSLGQKAVIRTKDFLANPPKNCEIEDLLRETLVQLAASDLGWDVSVASAATPQRPIVDVFKAEAVDFSKYTLAKAFLRWSRDHQFSDLKPEEIEVFSKLISHVNRVLK